MGDKNREESKFTRKTVYESFGNYITKASLTT